MSEPYTKGGPVTGFYAVPIYYCRVGTVEEYGNASGSGGQFYYLLSCKRCRPYSKYNTDFLWRT